MSVRNRKMKRSRSSRRGAAALEFALILPLLITIVLGCVDFGRFAHVYITVTNATRAGAGFASFNPFTTVTRPAWEARIRKIVEDEMGTRFDPAQIDVPSPVVTNDGGGLRRVRVQVSYPFEMLVNWPLMPNALTLSHEVEMRFVR